MTPAYLTTSAFPAAASDHILIIATGWHFGMCEHAGGTYGGVPKEQKGGGGLV